MSGLRLAAEYPAVSRPTGSGHRTADPAPRLGDEPPALWLPAALGALAARRLESEQVKVSLPFDEAIRRALRVPPPPEGWAAERRGEQSEKPRRKRAAG